jgi:hypothetical protein
MGAVMNNNNNHPDCPRCDGVGFYLHRAGHGYYRDGSFGHNDWRDCDCSILDKRENLPLYSEPHTYHVTNEGRWGVKIYNKLGDEIDNSDDLFFVSDLAASKWAWSKGAKQKFQSSQGATNEQ